ncbi:MAG TPA: twin-arginine translocation signal domain-containing protein, partial [Lacipirellulaceae bacterium]|nr:twin-arginine translocation signal domain-containing protein [Lacipirellulaceae bacterium]
MSERNNDQAGVAPSRRHFLKTTSALMGGAMLGANSAIASSAHPSGSDEIKVAVIGCGG